MAMNASPRQIELGRRFVLGLLFAIGLLDVACGLRMLLGSTPWLQNGQGAPWLALPVDVQAQLATGSIALGLYRRIGAFWLHAGLVTLAWTWWVRADWRGRTLLLLTYSVSGVGLGWCDSTFAAGTDWLVFKRAIGGAWTIALLVHFLLKPRSAAHVPRGTD
jgi:hypothetical protein